tara:strand:- start:13195 stop:13509 length:315 start_codon:yes stop_codon:yes gene_type:complete
MIYRLKKASSSEMEKVAAAAMEVFGVTYHDLTKKDRTEPLASVRGLVGAVLYVDMKISRNHVAAFLHRNPTLVTIYGQNHLDRMITDRQYCQSYHALKSQLEKE